MENIPFFFCINEKFQEIPFCPCFLMKKIKKEKRTVRIGYSNRAGECYTAASTSGAGEDVKLLSFTQKFIFKQ